MLFLADEYEQTDQKLEAKVYQALQLQVALVLILLGSVWLLWTCR